jgi:hypothetical protein
MAIYQQLTKSLGSRVSEMHSTVCWFLDGCRVS